ncbi:MAG: serine/threonine-protein kinase, partial [Gemmatimonadota bacterium]|nr:serine/threonine-protein kinase [Gemmatimonadota bacterium]
GESLRDRLAREGELPVDHAARIFREIVDALGHAHAQGVVHRDVKPDNVLLSGGHAVVTDFGVAKAVSDAAGARDLTTAGMALGTPLYMSPEQAAGDPAVDHRSDLYATGIVAYEMLTGRPPFTGSTPTQILSAQLTEVPEPVDRRREKVPPGLAAIVMRCLEKKPADRWQDAAEILREIDAVSTPSFGTMPVASVAPRRRRIGVLLGSALALAAVLAAIFVLRPTEEAVPTDPDRLVIVPFTPAVPDTALARLGREMVVLLATNLDGVGDLSAVLGSSVLAQAPDRQYTLEEGIELARSFGAGTAIHASLLRKGDRVRAEGVIASVDGGRERRFRVSGPLSDKVAFGDSVSWSILRELWEEGEPPSPRIADKVGTSSLEALSAFLEGERAFVENRFADAADAYERAFMADSTFWMAYRQYDRSQDWFIRETPAWIVEAYSEHRDELPEAERRMLEAAELPMPQELERLHALTVEFPDYWPVSFQYADMLVHWGPLRTGVGVEDARAAWDRTLEQNPRLLPAWHHLWWTHMISGDSARAFELLDTVAAMDGRSVLETSMGYDLYEEMRLISQARFERSWDAAAFDTLTSELARTRTNLGGFHGLAATWSGRFGAPEFQVAWNRAVSSKTALRDVADTYAVATAFTWAERGAWDSALVTIRAPAEAGVPDAPLDAYRLAVLGAWLGATDPTEADRWREGAELEAEGEGPVELTWLDGILAVAR